MVTDPSHRFEKAGWAFGISHSCQEGRRFRFTVIDGRISLLSRPWVLAMLDKLLVFFAEEMEDGSELLFPTCQLGTSSG